MNCSIIRENVSCENGEIICYNRLQLCCSFRCKYSFVNRLIILSLLSFACRCCCAIVLHCNFKRSSSWMREGVYTCGVDHDLNRDPRVVANVTGDHIETLNNHDVLYLSIVQQRWTRAPLNISNHFLDKAQRVCCSIHQATHT